MFCVVLVVIFWKNFLSLSRFHFNVVLVPVPSLGGMTGVLLSFNSLSAWSNAICAAVTFFLASVAAAASGESAGLLIAASAAFFSAALASSRAFLVSSTFFCASALAFSASG